MNEQNPIEVFEKEAPDVASAFDGLIQSLIRMKGLDQKTKQLVYIGIKASQGDSLAIRYHVPMAKQAGATRDEIKDTVLLTLSSSGLMGVVSCLPMALKAYDETP